MIPKTSAIAKPMHRINKEPYIPATHERILILDFIKDKLK